MPIPSYDDPERGSGWIATACNPAVAYVWSDDYNVRLERTLWLTVLRYHIESGVADPRCLPDYIDRAGDVDLDSIAARERITRHDVKARIDEYNRVAGGWEQIHLGMTSADVVDNTSQYRLKRSLQAMAWRWEGVWPGRFDQLRAVLDRWPLRGIKGAVGTQQDQIDLLGSQEAADELDRRVADGLGFKHLLGAVGQVYHRSLDFQVLSELLNLGLIAPWSQVVLGYVGMTAGYAGETWNEGDVSTSAVRRVALPNAVMATAIALQHEHEQTFN